MPPNGSFCVIACLNIQYFLYFSGNEPMLEGSFGATNALDMAKLGHFWFRMLAVLLACVAMLQTIPLTAEQVPVRHMEGLMHGFLAWMASDLPMVRR